VEASRCVEPRDQGVRAVANTRNGRGVAGHDLLAAVEDPAAHLEAFEEQVSTRGTILRVPEVEQGGEELEGLIDVRAAHAAGFSHGRVDHELTVEHRVGAQVLDQVLGELAPIVPDTRGQLGESLPKPGLEVGILAVDCGSPERDLLLEERTGGVVGEEVPPDGGDDRIREHPARGEPEGLVARKSLRTRDPIQARKAGRQFGVVLGIECLSRPHTGIRLVGNPFGGEAGQDALRASRCGHRLALLAYHETVASHEEVGRPAIR
jgi:hypothetical protein